MLIYKPIAFFCLLILLVITTSGHAEYRSFTKEYTYQASEHDSKITCRTNAITEVKRLLLEELGSYIESHTEVINLQATRDEIVSVTSGTVKSEIIDERWDGRQFWIKANLTADPDEVLQTIKENRKTPAKEPNRLIKRGREYRITFHSAEIKPSGYSKDDSNPAPDAYLVVKDGQGNSLFNSGDVFSKQKNSSALLGNRNNYTPDFRGIGFNHIFSSDCISVYLIDWDGCEGFLCKSSSKDDVIGSVSKICVGDKIGKRLAKAEGWQLELDIVSSEAY